MRTRRDWIRWSFCSMLDGAGGVGGDVGTKGAMRFTTVAIIAK